MPTNKSGNRGRRRQLLRHQLQSSRKPKPPSPLAALFTATVLLCIIILFPLALSYFPLPMGPVGANAAATTRTSTHKEKPPVIAIDFGTTNSRVGKGAWVKGKGLEVVGGRVANYVAFRPASTNGTMDGLDGMVMGSVVAGNLQGKGGNGVYFEEQVMRNGEGGKRGAWRGDGRGTGEWRKLPEGFPGYKEGVEVLVGEEAREWARMNGGKGAVVFDVGRILGRSFPDPVLENLRETQHLPLNVQQYDDMTAPVIEVEIEDRSIPVNEGADGNTTASKRVLKYTPEQITAIILRELKDIAEREIGEVITQAVITVPLAPGLHHYAESYEGYGDLRSVQEGARQYEDDYKIHLRYAASLAGLDVIRFSKEPLAAAIGYGVDMIVDFMADEGVVLVYDLGATSLDVTVMLVDSGVFEVVGHERVEGWWGEDGFDGTGGRKVTENVASWILREVASRMNNGDADDGGETGQLQGKSSTVLDPRLVRKIREEVAEGVKIALSEQEAVDIDVSMLLTSDMGGIKTNLTLTRKEFEDLNHILVEETLPTIQRVLSAANTVPGVNLSLDKVDKVLVVGGSGKIPMVRRTVERHIGREKSAVMNGPVDPAEAVFTGGVYQAMILTGEEGATECGFFGDYSPVSIGVETVGGVMTTMLHRGLPMPWYHVAKFTTSIDNQTSINLKIFQGDRPFTVSNDLLASIPIDLASVNQSNLPRGVPRVTFEFRLDVDGVLQVFLNETIETAHERLHQPLIFNLQTDYTNKSQPTWKKIQPLIDEGDKFREEDMKILTRLDEKRDLAGVLNGIRRGLWAAEANGTARETSDEIRAMEDALQKAEVWLNEHWDVETNTIEDLMKEKEMGVIKEALQLDRLWRRRRWDVVIDLSEEVMKEKELLLSRAPAFFLDIVDGLKTDELPPAEGVKTWPMSHEEL